MRKARALSSLDCTRCGACCTNPAENRAEQFVDYVEVLSGDSLLAKPELVRRLVVRGGDGALHLRLDLDGRCLALRGSIGRRVRCTIYIDRPTACRKVEPGTPRCLAERRQHGLS
jgi:Fe-S-cluster containining protein